MLAFEIPAPTATPTVSHPYQVRLEKEGDACAFRALPANAIGGPLRSTGKLRIIFATGNATAIEADRGILLHKSDTWQPGERIVIIVDKVSFTDQWRLLAMRQVDAEREDILHCALGGFDLDHTGAVLADSFFDIVEAPVAPEPVEPGIHPTCARMRDIILANNADGLTTDEKHLKRFTREEMDAHWEDAKAAADAITVRELDGDRGYETRTQRLERAVTAALAEMREKPLLILALRRVGFSDKEVVDLWPDLIPATAAKWQSLMSKTH